MPCTVKRSSRLTPQVATMLHGKKKPEHAAFTYPALWLFNKEWKPAGHLSFSYSLIFY